jgi:acyl carrier protein
MTRVEEPRIRHLIAEQLGVAAEELAPEVSLTDELAVDSLDLLEIALTVEQEFGIVIPETEVATVRTYGDLLTAIEVTARGEPAAASSHRPPLFLRARMMRGCDELQRRSMVMPATVQALTRDALRAGGGVRLEMAVSPDVDDDGLRCIQEEFAWLREQGVEVRITRDPRPRAA